MDMTSRPLTASRFTTVSPLSRLTACATFGIALATLYLNLTLFGLEVPGLIIIGVTLTCAALVFTGWRWAPLAGLLPALALPSLLLVDLPLFINRPFWPAVMVVVGCSILVLVLGPVAAMQNYRRLAGARPLPRWSLVLALLVGGAVAGAGVVGAIPSSGTAGITPEALASLPVLATHNIAFSQGEIRARVGETVALRLENSDAVGHSLDIDALNVHVPMLPGETSVTLFRPTQPGTYLFYCAPHYNKATGEGMQGTLIVE